MICSQCGTTSDTPLLKEQLEPRSETTSKRIQDLLASNVAPLGSERESLSDLMSRTQTYATSLDMRIADLRATLEDFLDQKATTERRLHDLKVTLHPIRTVPPEILAEIFDEAVSDTALVPLEKVRDGSFANSVDNSSQSCVVSQVSSAWRRTALKTQRLWRFVHVSFDRFPRNLSTSLFLNHFLTRSAEHTLHVMLHATVDHPALTVLLMTSSRWKTAAISFPPPIYRSWNAPTLSFRSLERLHLHLQLNRLHTVRDIKGGHRRVHMDTPQLRSFSSDTAAAVPLVIQPAYSRLERFEQTGALDEQALSGMKGVSFVAPMIMVLTPLMTSALFHVSQAVPDIIYSAVVKYTIHDAYPRLRALRLCGTRTGYSHFFSKFNLPCLELLSFEDRESGSHPAFPSPLIAPTGQQLEQLTVPIHNANDTDSLVALLRTTPKLCRLELRTRTRFDISHTIQAVLVDEKDLIPELTNLVLSSMDPDGMAVAGVFVEAIKHRRSGEGQVAKLQEVLVNYATDVDADVVAAFNDLLSDGLRGALNIAYDVDFTAEDADRIDMDFDS
ncbi:hypothetical protein BDZ89DRAFT_1062906 [Hymenopellis radicata]|nr:hypothetical protein BDZ89DRAFT_1062906 [Hymenopellis radicata]